MGARKLRMRLKKGFFSAGTHLLLLLRLAMAPGIVLIVVIGLTVWDELLLLFSKNSS
jgi:hypothetical protein